MLITSDAHVLSFPLLLFQIGLFLLQFCEQPPTLFHLLLVLLLFLLSLLLGLEAFFLELTNLRFYLGCNLYILQMLVSQQLVRVSFLPDLLRHLLQFLLKHTILLLQLDIIQLHLLHLLLQFADR